MATLVRPERDLPGHQLVALAWPIALENLLNMSLTWVDSIIMNHKLGTGAFAAVQLSGQVFNMIGLALSILATGASIVISHQVGAGERAEAGRTAAQSLGLGVVVGAVLGSLIWLGAPALLGGMGATGTVLAQGVTFMRVLAAFMPAQALLSLLGAVLRATGNTRSPMTVTLVVNFLNAGLNYMLVVGLPAFALAGLHVGALGGGWGLFGSAFGTSLARCGGAALLLLVLRGGSLPVKLAASFRFKLQTVWRVTRMGLPGAAEFISYQGAQFVLTMLVASLGTAVIAARGLTFQMESFTYQPTTALAMAASILVGQLMGAGRRDAAVATGKKAMLYGVVSIAALALILILVPQFVVHIFTSDPAVVAIAVKTLRIAGYYKVGQCLNIVCGGIFRGAGNPQWPTLLTTLGTWLVAVPLAFLAVRMGWGLVGVVCAAGVDEILRGCINLWYFTTPRWRFRKV